MKKNFRTFLVLAASLYAAKASACDCIGFANAQQAAQFPGIVVARVTTQSFDENSGMGTLNIEKVYKGNPSKMTLEVQGQDGANCSSSILPPTNKSWIAIFAEGEYGGMVGCADGSLDINADGTIKMYLSKEVSVTEQEFSDLVNLKALPTVEGVSCQISTSRNYVDSNMGKGALDDVNFYNSLVSNVADPLSISYSQDLASDGLVNPLVAHVWASPSSQDANHYYVGVELGEPFFGISTRRNVEMDLTGYTQTDYLELMTYKDVNGVTKEDFGKDPFYAYNTNIYCNLTLNTPIVPYSK